MQLQLIHLWTLLSYIFLRTPVISSTITQWTHSTVSAPRSWDYHRGFFCPADDKIYLIGHSSNPVIYDVASETWSYDTRLSSVDQDISIDGQWGALIGNIFYFMNYDQQGYINYFDPVTPDFVRLFHAIPSNRQMCITSNDIDSLYIMEKTHFLKVDVTVPESTFGDNLPFTSVLSQCAYYDGTVYLFGGTGTNLIAKINVGADNSNFDSATWEILSVMMPHSGLNVGRATVAGNGLIYIAGFNSPYQTSVFSFDPNDEAAGVATEASLSYSRKFGTLIFSEYDNRLYALMGTGDDTNGLEYSYIDIGTTLTTMWVASTESRASCSDVCSDYNPSFTCDLSQQQAMTAAECGQLWNSLLAGYDSSIHERETEWSLYPESADHGWDDSRRGDAPCQLESNGRLWFMSNKDRGDTLYCTTASTIYQYSLCSCTTSTASSTTTTNTPQAPDLTCTGWPTSSGSSQERCEKGNTLDDGYYYAYNKDRGESLAVCGQDASCWCCRRALPTNWLSLSLSCTGWPSSIGSARRRCESGNDKNDGYLYFYNAFRYSDPSNAVCGEGKNCWCCRTPITGTYAHAVHKVFDDFGISVDIDTNPSDGSLVIVSGTMYQWLFVIAFIAVAICLFVWNLTYFVKKDNKYKSYQKVSIQSGMDTEPESNQSI